MKNKLVLAPMRNFIKDPFKFHPPGIVTLRKIFYLDGLHPCPGAGSSRRNFIPLVDYSSRSWYFPAK
jgi:hypothetical protein